MNDIYNILAKLLPKYEDIAGLYTKDKNEIDDSVQELMLYFMQMNVQILKDIYAKDGEQGLLKYGAVALKRALTSKRSAYYYKYKKYYANLINLSYKTTTTQKNYYKSIYNIAQEVEENIKEQKIQKIEAELSKLHWYDAKVFQLYYEGHTLDSLAKETKISRNSLYTTIDKVRTILKKELVNE
jgi:DNA-directed RNA polymerase specialized sigma24 family protein